MHLRYYKLKTPSSWSEFGIETPLSRETLQHVLEGMVCNMLYWVCDILLILIPGDYG
jgi:hypothetical protein